MFFNILATLCGFPFLVAQFNLYIFIKMFLA